MSEPFIGEIRMMPYTFAPRYWAWCNGQLLQIGQNTALFSIIGTLYGGDGRQTFALPNLQGRAPMHQGAGPGLSQRLLGKMGGYSTVPLSPTQIPEHTHTINAETSQVDQKSGVGNFPGVLNTTQRGRTLQKEAYSTSPGSAQLSHEALGSSGSNDAHENRQPYLGVNFCIALQGLYPSRS